MTEPRDETRLSTAAEILDGSAGGRPAAGDHDVARQHELVERRAELLPEEATVGSDDPEAQAQVILEDSHARTEIPNAAPTTHFERRSSEDTV
ncbi:MAG: hypothetical protein M3Q27_06190 [Actinomycetota bacterium]|nr:hypothetical protein [Actinomycetota bacterium]